MTAEANRRERRQERLSSGLLAHLDRLPPITVYSLGLKARPLKELIRAAKDAGMSERTFYRISQAVSWRKIPVHNASTFCLICQVDLVYSYAERRYLRETINQGEGAFAHLTVRQKARLAAAMEEIMRSRQD